MLRRSALIVLALCAGCSAFEHARELPPFAGEDAGAADLAVPDLAEPEDLTPNLDLIDPSPLLASIDPSTVPAGSPATTLTLTGARFDASARVLLDDGAQVQPLATVFISDSTLQATVPPALLADALTYQLTVAVGARASQPKPLTVENGVPVIAQLTPPSAPAGGSAFTLAVAGSRFVPSSTVRANGAALTTRYVSAARLDADVPAALLQQAGSIAITVENRAPGGGTSQPQALAVTACTGAPILTSIQPTTAATNTTFTLTATGGCFACGATSATLLLDGAAQATALGACTGGATDTASASLANLAAGDHTIAVRNPDGMTSSTLPLTVAQPNPAPTLASVAPTQAVEGSPAFTLAVTGTGFVAGMTVLRWNGSARATTVTSTTALSAAIGAADVAQAGTTTLTVFNPTPGGGTSAPLSFPIVKPPVLTSLSPPSALVGAAPPTVQLLGSSFLAGATATLGGSARAVAFVSSSRLDLTLVAGDTAAAGSFDVVVTNPGAVPSNKLAFLVQNPKPQVSAVAPCGLVAGQPTALTIDGSGFVAGAAVSVAGATLAVASLTPTRITGTVTVTSAPSGNMGQLMVTNPSPSAGASAPFSLGIATQAVTAATLDSAVLTGSCAVPSCHDGRDTQLPGSLDLTAGHAVAQLVGVASELCPPKLRVVRCDPRRSASYLADKVESVAGARACNNDPDSAGEEMPPLVVAPDITPAQRQMIIDWIAQGAP